MSDKKNVLFVYADELSLACNISKSEGKIKCSFEFGEKEESSDEFNAFTDFLEGKNKLFKTKFGIFKREEE